MKTLLTATEVTATDANISVRYNESCSQIATLVLPASAAAPTSLMDFGSTPLTHWLYSTPKNTFFTNTATGLTAATAYKAYTMACDDTGNETAVDAISFWTP